MGKLAKISPSADSQASRDVILKVFYDFLKKFSTWVLYGYFKSINQKSILWRTWEILKDIEVGDNKHWRQLSPIALSERNIWDAS